MLFVCVSVVTSQMSTLGGHTAGFVVNVRTMLLGMERLADPVVPLKVTYMPMLDHCHEPQVMARARMRVAIYSLVSSCAIRFPLLRRGRGPRSRVLVILHGHCYCSR